MALGPARTHRNDRLVAIVQAHAASLLRLARKHSLCADDAQDAYQRALEIFLRKADDVEEATAASWLRTVVKHEAMAVRAQRQRYVGREEVDPDAWVSVHGDGEERALAFERVTRAAEALQSCKRDEASAMVLKADGHSYKEIAELTGWSYTKVNRCLAEGRARFLERYGAIESGEECRRVAPVLWAIVDGDAAHDDLRSARRHLRGCGGCRATLRELQDARTGIHSLLPAGVLAGAAPSLLQRAWENLFAGAQTAVLRVQALVEAGATTKAAAVAASAAAVAGGGAAVADRDREPAPRTPAARLIASAPAPAPAAATLAAAARSAPAPAPAVAAHIARPPRSVREPRRRSTRGPAPARRSHREFGFEAAAAAPTAAPSPATAPAATPTPVPPVRHETFNFERSTADQ